MAQVGIVTILYNSEDIIEGFIKSLSLQTYKDYHLYIIDNTPSIATDNQLKRLIQLYPIEAFSHTKTKENVGFSKGNNIAIKQALTEGCEFILIANNDIEFNQVCFLKTMVDIAIKRGESMIVPKIFFYDTKKIWMAGGFFKWWNAMGVHFGEWQDDKLEFNKERYCNFAPLCVMLLKSKVFESVGLLDENYFVYYEDTDFAYRAAKNGFKIFYYPNINVLHKVGGSTGGSNSLFSIYYGNRNRIYFIKKHFGFFKKIIAYSFVLSTRLIKYFKYNKKQKKELIRAIKDGLLMKVK